VIKLGEVVMILDLHRQELTVSAIARALGVDRKTVRRCIARGLETPVYGRSPQATQTVDRSICALSARACTGLTMAGTSRAWIRGRVHRCHRRAARYSSSTLARL
jgi:Winged helix-turn helix